VTSATRDYWQIQDAKQRFSEMIRAVVHDGPQIITRHGEEVPERLHLSVLTLGGDRAGHLTYSRPRRRRAGSRP
jgi:hypothetical protein